MKNLTIIITKTHLYLYNDTEKPFKHIFFILFNRKHVRDFTAVRSKNDLGYLKFNLESGTHYFCLKS